MPLLSYVFRTQSPNYTKIRPIAYLHLSNQCYTNVIFCRHIAQNTHPGLGWVLNQKNITYKQYKHTAVDAMLRITLITFLQNLIMQPRHTSAMTSTSSSQKCASMKYQIL